MSLGRGWKPNVVPFEKTFSGLHHLSKSRAGLALGSSDLTEFSASMMDQGPTSACTAHATSDAAVASFGKAGQALKFTPSMRDLYALTRSIERAREKGGPVGALVDEGAYPTDVMEAISAWGLRPMGPTVEGRFSDIYSGNVNAEVNLDDLEADGLTRIESHAIYGTNLVEDTCAALSQYACPTGIFVDTAFEDWDLMRDGFVGSPRNPSDPNGGGHYVDIVGFVRAGLLANQAVIYVPRRLFATGAQVSAIAVAAAKLPSADPVFVVKNSWGPTWGVGGFFLATRAWLEDRQTSDTNAILPTLKETP